MSVGTKKKSRLPPKPSGNGHKPVPEGPKVTAEELATQQREISVSEFFMKNRHLLGFDNPSRALLTSVKEAVDNSLDACEEAGVLPDVSVLIEQKAETRFKVVITDNGPGIVKAQLGKIFGKLLYGSKFHRLKMSRGQQGIGISAAVLYGQLTTGKPAIVVSRTGKGKPANSAEVSIETHKNEPLIHNEQTGEFKGDHGTRIEIEMEAAYKKGEKGVDGYIKQTALANPHIILRYTAPGEQEVVFDRATKEMPPEPKAIKPHPYGIELGHLIKILQSTKTRQLKACLQSEFSRVSPRIAADICNRAGVPFNSNPHRIAREEAEKLFNTIQQTKIMAPPTNCISPIGESQIEKALKANVDADFYTAVTRPPAVYRGNPFIIEAGLAFGVKGMQPEDTAQVLRVANRVPLLYQPGACAITKAVNTTDWRNYGLSQPKNSPPSAPMMLFVHMGSVWVPFTSEAKEAVAHYPEIIKEIRLALQEAGRRLNTHINKQRKAAYELKRRSIFELYIEELSTSLNNLSKCGREKVRAHLRALASKMTKSGEIQ